MVSSLKRIVSSEQADETFWPKNSIISARWFFSAEMAVRYTSLAAAMIRTAEHPSRPGPPSALPSIFLFRQAARETLNPAASGPT
jgi:hypothetical protein